LLPLAPAVKQRYDAPDRDSGRLQIPKKKLPNIRLPEVTMRRIHASALLIALLFGTHVFGQLDKIVIPAGTPEDQALTAITNEADPQKRIAMLDDFVQKFAANPAAVAYGNWQLEQAYSSAGDNAKALNYGDKALAASPRNLDILVSQAGVAQQAKEWGKVADYAVRGGEVYNSLGKQTKPADTSDADFQNAIESEKASGKSGYEFLEAAGFNAITAEQDPKLRMTYIERFTPAFPSSKFDEQVSQYAIYTLQQLNESPRVVAYGEKALAANPSSIPTLILLANAYAEDPKGTNLTKAMSYARKAIELAKPDAPDADRSRKLSAGVAHSALGYALMREDKTLASIAEFKSATELLKEEPNAYSTALYRLGYGYAKINKLTEARAVLNEAVNIPGPFQGPSRELLAKVNSARAKSR
jgi:tetratricopeptide (TPR) repeat protein